MRDRKQGRLICIMCPRGCTIEYRLENREKDGAGYIFTGQGCRKGEDYAAAELTCPQRLLTTTIRTAFSDFPRLPVKTDRQIPLEEIFAYMHEINGITGDRRYRCGETIRENLLGRGTSLIATDSMYPPSPGKTGESNE